jgi:hypothetical protein
MSRFETSMHFRRAARARFSRGRRRIEDSGDVACDPKVAHEPWFPGSSLAYAAPIGVAAVSLVSGPGTSGSRLLVSAGLLLLLAGCAVVAGGGPARAAHARAGSRCTGLLRNVCVGGPPCGRGDWPVTVRAHRLPRGWDMRGHAPSVGLCLLCPASRRKQRYIRRRWHMCGESVICPKDYSSAQAIHLYLTRLEPRL